MGNIQAHVNEARRTGEIEFFIEERSEDCVVRTRVTGDNDRLLAEVTTNHVPAK
jgi:hypothetical protein